MDKHFERYQELCRVAREAIRECQNIDRLALTTVEDTLLDLDILPHDCEREVELADWDDSQAEFQVRYIGGGDAYSHYLRVVVPRHLALPQDEYDEAHLRAYIEAMHEECVYP